MTANLGSDVPGREPGVKAGFLPTLSGQEEVVKPASEACIRAHEEAQTGAQQHPDLVHWRSTGSWGWTIPRDLQSLWGKGGPGDNSGPHGGPKHHTVSPSPLKCNS